MTYAQQHLQFDEPLLLRVDAPARSALTFALTRTVDDLEARAVLAERHGDDPGLGESSAAEYRNDAAHLMALLSQAGVEPREAGPDGEALTWLDGLYVIVNGDPQRVGVIEPLRRLLAVALRRSTRGHVSGLELADAIAASTGQSVDDLLAHASPDGGADETAPAPTSV